MGWQACRLFLVLLLLGFSGTSGQADEKTDLAACYGESLEIALEISQDGNDTTEIVGLRLPQPQRWYLKTSHRSALDNIPCQQEPVATRSALGRFHSDDKLPLPGAPKALRELRIFSWKSSLVVNGKRITDPFSGVLQHRDKTGDVLKDTAGGQSGLEPIEGPVFWSCNQWTCTIGYALRGNLYLEYKIRNDGPGRATWPAQDAALRRLVSTWME